ncbi:MAG: flavodoxin [Clostridia bacterium]|nr:flavodoxin [Clostridia bacterium]
MSKVAVVFWSGTGNTAAMAASVEAGAKAAGADVSSFSVSDGAFSAAKMDEFDAIAFGCPSMGAEVLEESEMQPLFDECKGKLNGKKIALFGSYGWGDGEWMRNWESECKAAGAVMACDFVICNEAPDAQAKTECEALGKALA